MSLLDNASLVLTPNAVKASKLYSVIPSNGNGDFTATRATTATRINPSGLVESVALNVPRLDYSLGGCPNILLEPQRTNLALQSSSFDSASWTKTASSVTANSTTSPSGIQDADTYSGDGGISQHRIEQTLNVVNATTYSWSVYAKKNTNNFIQLTGFDSGFGTSVFANFDLNSGVVGSVGAGTTASITNVGNGWYRCAVNMTSITTGSSGVQVYLITSATAIRKELSTLSTSVFLWGAQLEAGAYATSYIPTTTASVTRNADTISKTGISSLLNPSETTLFVETKGFVNDTSNRFIQISNGTDTSNAFINFANNQIIFATVSGGTQFNRIVTANPSNNNKIILSWKSGSIFCFVNGTKYNLNLVGGAGNGIPTALDRINFSLWWGGNPFFGSLKQLSIWNTQLTDAQCIALTQ